ncbi:uncharacterized protein SPPG_02990 [Spizellomyces punctatus DAOM BR117]|uniref:TauD/TfdA-like domain-containing protein n=1 Tax=Spizellomyces punctatus (strain DAOM BR117) TaxID=645134 RepID=A0A0L0HM66_SPIPD|nr:uncharacterized protein SPPG_02990 [Spizellomyces punctatus DAOM BR117]KND02531.1 hypothetical protein SPPG_02990 [Spizellomyces punctatus DAOM BR117]|eukprot:XP_016610570.1 hypothetical protein SPPG_02990 [Spizellomyces punctatus DAOM BR117]
MTVEGPVQATNGQSHAHVNPKAEARFKPACKVLNALAGKKADPQKKSLLDAVTKRVDLSPVLGTELHGIQLSQLTEQQKEDLALLVSERGVVFFRDQDIDLDQQQELGKSWGPLHVHPIGRKDEAKEDAQIFQTNEASKIHAGDGWHTDISFEEVPSAYAILKLLEVPPVGGDTIWVSTYAAYDKLSPSFRDTIEHLTALHNAEVRPCVAPYSTLQYLFYLSRSPSDILNLLVRTHPTTGWKILFVNSGFTKHIKGYTKAESDALLHFLTNHIATSDDIKVRFRWEKNSVAIWDNRATQHLALWDYYPNTRHAQRVVVLGERPYYDPKSKSQLEAGGALYQAPPQWTRDIDGGKLGYKW